MDGLSEHILSKCKGVVACAIVLLNLGKLIIFSNNGSLFYSEHNENFYFSSEEYKVLGLKSIHQLVNDSKIIDIEKSEIINDIIEFKNQRLNLVPELVLSSQNEKLLKYEDHDLKRCTKCILPEIMPYISFDDKGVAITAIIIN